MLTRQTTGGRTGGVRRAPSRRGSASSWRLKAQLWVRAGHLLWSVFCVILFVSTGEESMKGIRVLKFGGTSVANAERLRQVAAIIARDFQARDRFPVVVVSAMAGVTDFLFELAG